ncbi:MAG: acyl-[ACP]--phospholipid O-acyltransferase [Gammaproteobacteria bacterium]
MKSLHLLHSRRFLPLFITQALGAFNDNLFKNALVLLITYQIAQQARSAELLVVACGGIFILPFFIFSATAGQLADKYDKAYLARITKLFEVIAMLIAGVGFATNNLWILITTLFLLGTQSAFFGPIKYAILPEQLHHNELISGNALIEASTFIAILLGTIAGGTVIALSTHHLIITGFCLLVAVTGLLASFFIPTTGINQPTLRVNKNIFTASWHIIKTSKHNHLVFLVTLGISWFWLIGASILSLLPSFTKNILGAREIIVTVFLTVFSIGIAVGSFIAEHIQRDQINAKFVPLAMLGMSVFMVDLYFASHALQPSATLYSLADFLSQPAHWRLLIDMLAIAISGGIYIVPLYALIQTKSAARYRSRMVAVVNIMNALFMVISAIIIAVLLSMHVTIPQVIALLGCANLLAAGYSCRLLPNSLSKSLVKCIFKLCFRVEVRGLHHYQQAKRNALIIANHVSFLDAMLLGAFLPGKLLFAVSTHFSQQPIVKQFLNLFEIFTLDSTNSMSLRHLIQDIQKRQCHCLIFPEGRLTTTGTLMKTYEGAALLADKLGTDIIPIHLEGVQYSLFSYLKKILPWHLFPKITITILPARMLQIPETLKGQARRKTLYLQLDDLMREFTCASHNLSQPLFSTLLDSANTFGYRHTVLEDHTRKSLNYRQLIARCFILGKQLQQQISTNSNHTNQHIGVLLPNNNAVAITFFALQIYGYVPAMLNYTAGVLSINNACQLAQLRYVISAKQFITRAKLQDIVTTLHQNQIQLIYLEDIAAAVNIRDKFTGILASYFARHYYQRLTLKYNSQQAAVILFTSGSESMPKGVVLSHSNIQANRYQLHASIAFNAHDRIFNALPTFHTLGLTAGLILPIISGIKTFLYLSPLHYRVIPELIYQSNSTILFSTNHFLAHYGQVAHPYDFYAVRLVFAGAEKLQAETRELWLNKFGIRILEGYGATEASPIITTNTLMHYKANTVGRFLPLIEHRIESIAGINEGGRLWVKGPNIMFGYLTGHNNPLFHAPVDGWHDTGDIVTIDCDVFVTLQGRIKRFAKIAGEMISLTHVEQYLKQLWPDASHAVIAIQTQRHGEKLVLITTQANAHKQTITHYFKRHGLTELYVPKIIFTMQQLPVLATGKIDYVSLHKWVDAQQ